MPSRTSSSVSVFAAILLAPMLLVGCLAGPGGVRRSNEVKTEAWVKVPASHPVVQSLAAFSVEEFASHSFRTTDFKAGSHFDVLEAERLATKHEDAKLVARNYKITIRLVIGSCSVHQAHVLVYPATNTKMVMSRVQFHGHEACMSGSNHLSGDFGSPSAPGTRRYMGPLLSTPGFSKHDIPLTRPHHGNRERREQKARRKAGLGES